MAKLIVRDLLSIFNSGVNAVRPDVLVKNCLKFNSVTQLITANAVNANNTDVSISVKNKSIHIVGTGKAVKNMAKTLDGILTYKIRGGIISIPLGNLDEECNTTRLQYFEGAENNLPDTNAEATAKKINDLAMSLGSDDILLVLISGGGSALLPMPKPPITLEEKTALIKKLANSGADIKELNVVRKKLSSLKGGKLAFKAQPAKVVSLILSDIVGDPLDLIASGPTVKNTDAPNAAKEIVQKFNLVNDLPDSIKTVLDEDENLGPFPDDNVTNIILGSNKLSIAAAIKQAEALKWSSISLSNAVTGNVREVAQKYAYLAKIIYSGLTEEFRWGEFEEKVASLNIPEVSLIHLCYYMEKFNAQFKHQKVNSEGEKDFLSQEHRKGICLILGGETTVEVKGTGKGGRNQHLALEFSNIINNMKDDFAGFDIGLLSAGTDGIDGPTDAAGAIGYLNLVTKASEKGINVQEYLDNCDSYHFYEKFNEEYHVITGHTNTNVMDLHILLIRDKNTAECSIC